MGGICNFNTTADNSALNMDCIGTEHKLNDENVEYQVDADAKNQLNLVSRIEEADKKYNQLFKKKKSRNLLGSTELKELDSQIHMIRVDLDKFSETTKLKYAPKIKELSNGIALLKF